MESQRCGGLRFGVRPRFALVAALALATTLALAGCVQAAPAKSAPTAPVSPTTPTSTASGTPIGPPVYNPKGTAAENLPYFKKVGHALLDHHQGANGRTIVDYFVAHGFDKKNMEITPDKTSIGLAAWNIEFSVKMNGTCIIGQAGNVRFQSFAAPLLATGKCLIGTTRKIDW